MLCSHFLTHSDTVISKNSNFYIKGNIYFNTFSTCIKYGIISAGEKCDEVKRCTMSASQCSLSDQADSANVARYTAINYGAISLASFHTLNSTCSSWLMATSSIVHVIDRKATLIYYFSTCLPLLMLPSTLAKARNCIMSSYYMR
ncbi:unnamed protein product [Ceratitis capitata]|uniref:(Mediterranean fruit fly) hypothetical protein n=1 Tax=Ceratitis capitata TaxID=7213 RepID=A0A811VMV7_CERCA|nr:unnamed protein product [Ceratitis capitata]